MVALTVAVVARTSVAAFVVTTGDAAWAPAPNVKQATSDATTSTLRRTACGSGIESLPCGQWDCRSCRATRSPRPATGMPRDQGTPLRAALEKNRPAAKMWDA